MLPGIVAGWLAIVALALAFLRHLNTMAWILLGIGAALELTTLCLKPRNKTRPPARPSGTSPPTPPTSTATRPRGRGQRGAGSRR